MRQPRQPINAERALYLARLYLGRDEETNHVTLDVPLSGYDGAETKLHIHVYESPVEAAAARVKELVGRLDEKSVTVAAAASASSGRRRWVEGTIASGAISVVIYCESAVLEAAGLATPAPAPAAAPAAALPEADLATVESEG